MGRLSREAWSAHVEAWRRSGQSAEAFAAKAGLSAARLEYWGSRVGRAEAAAGTELPRALAVRPVQPAWVELMACAQTAAPAAPLEVVVANGRAVRVPVGFDAETLRRVIGVMEAA
jgi:hypothetical protein